MVTPVLPPRAQPTASRRRLVLGEVRVALIVLAGGVLMGAVWALAAPALARSADLGESRVAVDGLLALLGVGAGLVTAVVLLAAPGPRIALRLLVVLGASLVAGVLAAVIGVWFGGLKLGAPGVALLWPLTAAVLTTLRTLAGLVISPDDDGPRPPRRHAGTGVESRDDGPGRADDLSERPEP